MSQRDTTSDRHIDSALSNINKMSEYIQTGRQEVLEVGIDLLENKVENPNMKNLQECIVELVKAEQRVKAFTKSVMDIKTRWQNGDLDESEDVVQILENDLQAEEEKSPEEKNVWDHEFMVAFVTQMKEVDGGVSLQVGAQAGGSKDKDDDMQMTQTQVSIKCPITQSDMTDPVMDKKCGHSFENDAIRAHIKQNLRRKKTPKCPYPGCNNVLKLENLEANVSLKHVIQRKKRAAPSNQST